MSAEPVTQVTSGDVTYVSLIPSAFTQKAPVLALCNQIRSMLGAGDVALGWFDAENNLVTAPDATIEGDGAATLPITPGLSQVAAEGEEPTEEGLEAALKAACPGFRLMFQQKSASKTLRVCLRVPTEGVAALPPADMQFFMARVAAEYPSASLVLLGDPEAGDDLDAQAYGIEAVQTAFPDAQVHVFPTAILQSLMGGEEVAASSGADVLDAQAYEPEGTAAEDAMESFYF